MSDEVAELRAELAALKQQLAGTNPLNNHLQDAANAARRTAGDELALRANRDANIGGVSATALEAARILMEHDPAFVQMAQKAKAND